MCFIIEFDLNCIFFVNNIIKMKFKKFLCVNFLKDIINIFLLNCYSKNVFLG